MGYKEMEKEGDEEGSEEEREISPYPSKLTKA